jgi:hypothetical protein
MIPGVNPEKPLISLLKMERLLLFSRVSMCPPLCSPLLLLTFAIKMPKSLSLEMDPSEALSPAKKAYNFNVLAVSQSSSTTRLF